MACFIYLLNACVCVFNILRGMTSTVFDESLAISRQLMPHSTLRERVSKPAKTRASRPIEDTFKKYFTHYSAADTKSYKEMITASIAQ